jgi:peptidoglycan/LPS O-acetylase OafA/YrhL
VGEAVLTVAVRRWRRPALVGTAVVAAAVLGWQAVLHLTHAREFFTGLLFGPFPFSCCAGIPRRRRRPWPRPPAPSLSWSTSTSTESATESANGHAMRNAAGHRVPLVVSGAGAAGGDWDDGCG